ncbi:hypothetical protein T439DRAFT_119661 [Meredithblackwellia eburnea MCA 4105]
MVSLSANMPRLSSTAPKSDSCRFRLRCQIAINTHNPYPPPHPPTHTTHEPSINLTTLQFIGQIFPWFQPSFFPLFVCTFTPLLFWVYFLSRFISPSTKYRVSDFPPFFPSSICSQCPPFISYLVLRRLFPIVSLEHKLTFQPLCKRGGRFHSTKR